MLEILLLVLFEFTPLQKLCVFAKAPLILTKILTLFTLFATPFFLMFFYQIKRSFKTPILASDYNIIFYKSHYISFDVLLGFDK